MKWGLDLVNVLMIRKKIIEMILVKLEMGGKGQGERQKKEEI